MLGLWTYLRYGKKESSWPKLYKEIYVDNSRICGKLLTLNAIPNKHFCFPNLSAMVNLCELNKKLVLCRLEMFTLAQILNPC